MLETLISVAISSLLVTVSMPGYVYGGFIFVALIPLFFALERKGPVVSSLLSFLYFFLFTFANFNYLINVLTTGFPELFGRFSSTTGFFVYILFCILEAIPFLLFGFLYGLWSSKIRYRFLEPLFAASLYVVTEFIRGIGDLGFTGGRLSDALYGFKGLLQLLPYTGTFGLLFIIVVVNYELYKLLRKSKHSFHIALSIIACLFLLNGVLETRLPRVIGSKPVVIAQTDLAQEVKYNYDISEIMNYLTDNFSHTPDYLTIFPEAVFPSVDIRNTPQERELSEVFGNRTVVIGYPTLEDNGAFNSLHIYENGNYFDRYDKVKLFPFVEMLPYKGIFGRLEFLKGAAYFDKGELKIFEIAEYGKIGLQVCFESYFPNISRELSKESEYLIVSTNDGWYNSKIALIQHFTQSVFRAVETRRNIVQVSNTGLSGLCDIYGNITILPYGTQWRVIYLAPERKVTLYAKYGDYFVIISLILIIISGATAKKRQTIFS
ncbi:MAG TPA: apolipoprotein N-acyltransferase [Fervidobacterium sp.]|nr:apolipoprotein N-acyltransferase [Fervidobacterium sp.]HOK87265.1 apolipoprotein N-acyltransferase [Fervidobacterium sp.]HOM73471.1 apolipoprotein N-acyltransferase [Fervidobacterium sp.]HPP17380.1 apolipoprotein N-acyltransferase [Fervidobacterium sp.]HPZ17436.1 apolipoprotein N-acyltransferase [Fervidobacterium sp.]